MGLGKVRFQLQGSTIAGDRFVRPSRLVGNHAEKMDRIDLIRLDFENLPVDLLGRLQPAGLVVADRGGQGFGNR